MDKTTFNYIFTIFAVLPFANFRLFQPILSQSCKPCQVLKSGRVNGFMPKKAKAHIYLSGIMQAFLRVLQLRKIGYVPPISTSLFYCGISKLKKDLE